MGYTHYFSFNSPKRGEADKTEKTYQRAIRDCQRIVKSFYKEYGGLSGYSAHVPLGKYGGINVNGKGDEAHEPFELREHFSQNEGGFCKTARKPYDTVVVACLALLKHRLKDLISVSSDGRFEDWVDGVEYAKKVTGLKIKNPIEKKLNLNNAHSILESLIEEFPGLVDGETEVNGGDLTEALSNVINLNRN
jgi:hypothetical protein